MKQTNYTQDAATISHGAAAQFPNESFYRVMKIVSNYSDQKLEGNVSQNSLNLCEDLLLMNKLANISEKKAAGNVNQRCNGEEAFIAELEKKNINGKAWLHVGVLAIRAAKATITAPPLKLINHLVAQANSIELHKKFDSSKEVAEVVPLNPYGTTFKI